MAHMAHVAQTAFELDPAQLAVLDAVAENSAGVSLIGAPGTGKTTVLVALAARAEASGKHVAVITQDRTAATSLRTAITQARGSRSERLTVQSLTAFAYAIVQRYAQAVGRRDPELISGPDEDTRLREILNLAGANITFPSFVTPQILELPGFREQIRNLMTRARELGLTSAQLRELAETGIAGPIQGGMWRAVSEVMDQYAAISEYADAGEFSDAPDRLDHSQLVATATANIANWEENVRHSARYAGAQPARPRWDLILVDDVQNAPRSLLFLLRELARDGARIVTAGSPDAAVQGFRGGVAGLPGILSRTPEYGGLGLRAMYLDVRHRGGPRLAGVAQRIESATHIAGTTVQHRKARAAEATAPEALAGRRRSEIRGATFRHAEEEAAYIAGYVAELQDRREGTQFSDIAIMTRSRNTHRALRDSLVRRGVPVEPIQSALPLRENPAVASLLGVIRAAFTQGPLAFVDPETIDIDALLTSPVLGLDPVQVKRESRRLRGAALARGQRLSNREVRRLVLAGAQAVRETGAHARALEWVGGVFDQIRTAGEAHAMRAESVLWAAWCAVEKAEKWRETALRSVPEAEAAGDNLDAVIQLFRVAQRLADRAPEARVEQLVEEVLSQDLPEDSIARTGTSPNAVHITTPSASQGREWKHVIIAQLGDGIWPNLRIRDAYTGTGLLTRVVTDEIGITELRAGLRAGQKENAPVGPAPAGTAPAGASGETAPAGAALSGVVPAGATSAGEGPTGEAPIGAARAVTDAAVGMEEVLDDELRQLLHAVTRAQESVLITAVENESDKPSRFFSLLGFDLEAAPSTDLASAEASANADVAQAASAVPAGSARTGVDAPAWGLQAPLGQIPMLRSPKPRRGRGIIETVGVLRRLQKSEDETTAHTATQLLEELAAAGYRMAGKKAWFDTFPVSTGAGPEARAETDPVAGSLAGPRALEPRHNDAFAQVRVSPSQVESLLESPLQAFLNTVGARVEEEADAASLGTLIHAIAEKASDNPDVEEMLAELERTWPEEIENYFQRCNYTEAQAMVEVLAGMLAYQKELYPHIEVEKQLSAQMSGGPQVSGKIDRLLYIPDTPEQTEPPEQTGTLAQTETLAPADADAQAGTCSQTDASAQQTKLSPARAETPAQQAELPRAEIVDIKTGKRAETVKGAADNAQMQVYQWLLEQNGIKAVGARLVYPRYSAPRSPEGIRSVKQEELGKSGTERTEEKIVLAGKLLAAPAVPVREEEEHGRGSIRIVSPLTDEGRLFS
ncbi:hypothetical protein ACU19_03340 [Actinobaculum suis]|uniref:PD-(D/E)XK nuclease family protein n=1 Tax=Actinobaculum suis TaxID=1657 RepID=UPI00066FD5C1|nr:PD-(D/E)XK nuclease family protein [Actinobaculum suis]KMY23489.1 hypothetical protein ACU19_03340 [Actinobaculum suis]